MAERRADLKGLKNARKEGGLDPRVIPVDDDEDGRLSSRMSIGDEDEEVPTASIAVDPELGKLKNSSFANKYSTVAGKKPPKELNDLSDSGEGLEAYSTRPRTSTVADKTSLGLK